MTKFVKKWGRSAALVLTVACLALGIGIAPAQAQPPGIPHNFYGYAYINGALATVGKTVVAKINDVQVGSTTVTTATGYNYQIQVSSATGGTVVFWVDGVQATPTATYNAGFYTQLNLYTYTTTLGVTTGSASSITSNSATLGGTLTGLGSSPTVYVSFEYGLTTAYGSTTPPQAMSATGAFSAPITGLSTSTTYNFRAKVTDGATTVNGSNATFTTTAPVLTVATGSATGITTSTATLTGTLSDMGAYSSVSVSFEYGPTTSYGSATTPQTKTTTGAFSATISGLTAGTTYYFRGKGVGGSQTAYGNQASFVTSSQSSGCSSGCCHWFWGTAYINSTAVSNGTVAALVNGVASGASTTTNSAGDYNIYVPVTSGATVTFTVNGNTAVESATGSCMGYNGNYNLHATGPTVLTITTTSLPYGLVGTAYSQTLQATGGTTPYTWSLASGTLPAGLTLNGSTGVISGTPTTTGTSSFTVQVTDAVLATDTQPLSIIVYATPPALTITTTSLAGGTVGTAYSQTLQAAGGTTPYTWSISSGTLPAGLTLNASTGVISGTPTTAGTSSFTIMVTDAVLATATQPLSITISTTPTPGSKLLGANDAAISGPYMGNMFQLFRFAAEQSGTLSVIKVKAFTIGNVKVAIYSDSNSIPSQLLGSSSNTTVTAGIWNSIAVTPTPAIVSGQYYWLAFVSDTALVGYNYQSTMVPAWLRYAPYSTFTFPDPAGSSGDFYTTVEVPGLIAGY